MTLKAEGKVVLSSCFLFDNLGRQNCSWGALCILFNETQRSFSEGRSYLSPLSGAEVKMRGAISHYHRTQHVKAKK